MESGSGRPGSGVASRVMGVVSFKIVDRSGSPYYVLSRCERQIMETIYQLDRASARDIHQRLPHNPRNSTVRAALANLERKGFLSHECSQRRYFYRPLAPRDEACLQMLRHVAEVFFSGSIEGAASALRRLQAPMKPPFPRRETGNARND